jgi:biopolymer transport protein ExbD
MKMSRRAKRMDRHHHRKTEATISLVPMIDLLTVLVFFLLVNAGDVQNTPSTKSLKLPESSAKVAPRETVMIVVTRQEIIVEGRQVATTADVIKAQGESIPALVDELRYQAQRTKASKSKTASPGEITIMGDQAIPYELLKKIIVSSTQAEYSKISLAVNTKSTKAE